MNEEWSRHAASQVAHWAEMTAENLRVCAADVAHEQMRPCVLMRPAIYPDGDQWCALYGEDLQRGVAGFGNTPELAMLDFDNNWRAARTRGEGGGT